MAKYSYWTGVRFWPTSNSQYDAPNGVWAGHVSATRDPSDTYVRSVWWTNVSYFSDGTGSVPGWWGAANVYFVAQFDPGGIITKPATLQTGEPSSRVAMAGLMPKRYSMPEFTGLGLYQVIWEGPPDGIITGQSRRKGNGTAMPRVAYGVYAVDQNGFFDGLAEPAYEIRCPIYGRVLWESDVP